MIPETCYWSRLEEGPQVSYTIKLNNKIVDVQKDKYEILPNYSKILEYEAGDKITITV